MEQLGNGKTFGVEQACAQLGRELIRVNITIETDEDGVVTGRRRRCGWLDLVSLKYSVRVNSLTELFITKLDVLSGLNELNVNIAYEINGSEVTDFPRQQRVLYDGKPIYKTLKGWDEDITNITSFDDLPEEAKDYIKFIEDFIKVPITFISVGPERNQNIIREK